MRNPTDSTTTKEGKNTSEEVKTTKKTKLSFQDSVYNILAGLSSPEESTRQKVYQKPTMVPELTTAYDILFTPLFTQQITTKNNQTTTIKSELTTSKNDTETTIKSEIGNKNTSVTTVPPQLVKQIKSSTEAFSYKDDIFGFFTNPLLLKPEFTTTKYKPTILTTEIPKTTQKRKLSFKDSIFGILNDGPSIDKIKVSKIDLQTSKVDLQTTLTPKTVTIDVAKIEDSPTNPPLKIHPKLQTAIEEVYYFWQEFPYLESRLLM